MNGILLVEDNQADALLIQEALRQASVHLDVERVPDGEAALRRLRNDGRPRHPGLPGRRPRARQPAPSLSAL